LSRPHRADMFCCQRQDRVSLFKEQLRRGFSLAGGLTHHLLALMLSLRRSLTSGANPLEILRTLSLPAFGSTLQQVPTHSTSTETTSRGTQELLVQGTWSSYSQLPLNFHKAVGENVQAWGDKASPEQ